MGSLHSGFAFTWRWWWPNHPQHCNSDYPSHYPDHHKIVNTKAPSPWLKLPDHTRATSTKIRDAPLYQLCSFYRTRVRSLTMLVTHSLPNWLTDCRLVKLMPVNDAAYAVQVSDLNQRHNGPEGWVLLTKVTSLSYITSSYKNLDKNLQNSLRNVQ